MKINVFVSESRVTRSKYVDEFKPKERVAYLKKYPRSSFKKITDEKGNIKDATKKENPKKKLSGKPRGANNKKAPVRKRNPVSQRLAKSLVKGARTQAQARAINNAIEKINNGTANKRNHDTLRKYAGDNADQLEKAINTQKKRAKADVENRRKEISDIDKKPTRRRKAVEEKPVKQTAKKPAPKKPTKPAEQPKPKADPKQDKPDAKSSATFIQQAPKAKRAGLIDVVRRVLRGKPNDTDAKEIGKIPIRDKTSREVREKLKRYAEARAKNTAPKKETTPVNPRKKLSKIQMLDRVKNTELPKIEKAKETVQQIKAEYKEQRESIINGKGTRAQREKKLANLNKSTEKKLLRQKKIGDAAIKRVQAATQNIRGEKDRKVGKR